MSYRRKQRKDRSRRNSKKYEEEAIVLDVMTPNSHRKRGRYSDEHIAQIVGTSWFTLLEIVPENANLMMLQDKIKLSKDHQDDNISTIIGRVGYTDLSTVAELQLPEAIETILEDKSDRFVKWLNTSPPISLRQHQLHLIKGIGPKSLKTILDERKVKDFESYEDFEDRTGISNIQEMIKNRIIEELSDDTVKHHLFTRGRKKERR